MSNRVIFNRLTVMTLALTVVAMTGCSLKQWRENGFKVGPNYAKPVANVAPDWIDATDARVRSDATDGANWWLVFNDPVLNDLISQANAQNLSLREAGMRVLEAKAQRGVAAGNLFPQSQTIDSSYTRNLISNTSNPPTAVNRSFDNWASSGSLVWEMDFWGRFRRAVEAADADLDASVENYDDVLTCLLAEVAATYVNIRTIQQRLDYTLENVEIQQGSLGIAQALAEGGQTSEVDVRQAELVLAQTQASVPTLKTALRQQNNLLCFLLGRPTEDLLPQLGKGPIPMAPESVAIGIPCELLRRRPDIRRAERKVAAQSATIGIAESDLYPHFNIVGQIGWQAQSIGAKFGSDANFGAISPGLSWDVLNYGRFKNNIEAQKASFQALALTYQNTVLSANQEVENNLARFLYAQDQTQFLAESVKAASGGVDLVSTQYQNQLINFNTVFNLQLSLVGQQDAYAVAQGDIALGLIGIYKALGGGWQIRNGGTDILVAEAPVPTEATSGDDSMLPEPPQVEPPQIENEPTDPTQLDAETPNEVDEANQTKEADDANQVDQAADTSSNNASQGVRFQLGDVGDLADRS